MHTSRPHPKQAHDSKTGHFGFVKTLHLIKWQFWWPSLKDIEAYVTSCPICAAAKWPPGKPTRLLQKVANPRAPWKEIPMDFIVELSKRNTFIWVVTDIFFLNKCILFRALKYHQLRFLLNFLFNICTGYMEFLTTSSEMGEGGEFTSEFWWEFLLGSAHHLQTNGMCECTNSVLEQYLRWYLNYQQGNWADLPFAELAYHNSVHSSLVFIPFKVASGQICSHTRTAPEKPLIPSLVEWIESFNIPGQ